MSEIRTIEIPVQAETAEALTEVWRRELIGRLVDSMVRPTRSGDPLAEVMDHAAREAQDAGLTDADIDAELEAYNQERRGA